MMTSIEMFVDIYLFIYLFILQYHDRFEIGQIKEKGNNNQEQVHPEPNPALASRGHANAIQLRF